MEYPSDLQPLPTAPYSERPNSLPLDTEECRTALWMVRGNVTEAAKLLKVTASRLRNFINKSAYLCGEQREAQEQLADIAEDVVYDALTDEEDKSRKDTMARFVLTNLAKSRGYGTGSSLNIKNSAGGTIVVQWADGTSFGGSDSAPEEAEGGGTPPKEFPALIEHEDSAA